MEAENEISLALSGGGAKCYAQLGVLHAIQQAGLPISGIAATSAACILAGLYAAGYSLDQIAAAFKDLNLRRLIRPAWKDGQALFSLSRIRPIFEELLGDRRFEDLDFPVAFTAVDLHSGQSLCLKEGRVLDALLAAVAVPGLFPPQPWAGRQLIDGGTSYSVPVSLARRIAPGRPVIAVALFPPYEKWDKHPLPQLLQSVPLLGWLTRWRVLRAFDIYVRANDITHRRLAELRLECDQPEVVVRPFVDHVGLFDRIDLESAWKIGADAMNDRLFDLQRAWSEAQAHRPVQKQPAPDRVEVARNGGLNVP